MIIIIINYHLFYIMYYTYITYYIVYSKYGINVHLYVNGWHVCWYTVYTY